MLSLTIGQEKLMADECEMVETDKLNKKSHRCTKCTRTFESGNALGGHVSSAHVQSQEDLQGQLLKCEQCEQKFASSKAVHGHMSAHRPEGASVRKKAKTNSKGPKTSSSGRGQASGIGIVNKSMFPGHVTGDQWFNQTHDSATRKLLQLAGSDCSAKDKNVVRSSQGPKQPNHINNPTLELKQQTKDTLSLKQQARGISSGKMIIYEHHGATNGNGDVTKISSPVDLAKFPCTLCNLTFTSYQALGGHKASHARNNKAHHVNTIDEQRNKQAKKQQQNAKSSHSGEQGPSTHAQLHRCNPCNKNFETHRGLKTHERSDMEGHAQVPPSNVTTSGNSVKISGPISISPSHVTTPNARLEINGVVGNSPNSDATSSAVESNQPLDDQPPRRVLSFDLNEPLDMEDDD